MKQTAVIVLLALISGCEGPESVQKPNNAGATPAANGLSQPALATDASANETTPQITIPDSAVSGIIGDQPFEPDTFLWDSDSLSLQVGNSFIPRNAVKISYFFPGDAVTPGQTFVWSKTDEFLPGKRFPNVIIRSDNLVQWVPDSYDLVLQMGDVNEKGQVTARFHLQTNEEPGAKITGSFTVTAPDVLSQLPQAWHRPWVVTRLQLPDHREHKVKVGFVGLTPTGKWKSNSAGTTLQKGEPGTASSLTFRPQVSTIASAENIGPHGRHIHLVPGTYVFYATKGQHNAQWKVVEITPDSAEELSFVFSPSGAGSLAVSVPDAKDKDSVLLIPLTSSGESPIPGASDDDLRFHLERIVGANGVENGTAQFANLSAGHYRVYVQRVVPISDKSNQVLTSRQSVDVEVQAGQRTETRIEFIQ